MEIYLDNNATTPIRRKFYPKVLEFLSLNLGNPSSSHSWGDRSSHIITQTRDQIASYFNISPDSILFNSGATEGNTQVLFSFGNKHSKPIHIISTTVEHNSVLNNLERLKAEGHKITYLPVNNYGLIKLADLEKALESPLTTLVSIQWVNNETGVIQDIPNLVTIAKTHGALFHSDASQAFGKIKIDLNSLPIDFLTFTGHKLHTPPGIGGLYVKDLKNLDSLLGGGDQENGLRPGTPNLLGIALLGVAIKDRMENMDEDLNVLAHLRDTFENRIIKNNGFSLNGSKENRVVNTTNIRFTGLDGRALTTQLDQVGIVCSQTSACTSQTPEPSHVLISMGLTEDEAYSSIRFSFSVENSINEAIEASEKVIEIAKKLKNLTNALNL